MGDFSNIHDNPQIFSNAADQISNDGGLINLTSGKTDNTGRGFYIAVMGSSGSTATANILNVKLKYSNTYINLPFYEGWNPLLVIGLKPYSGSTTLYWGY